MNLSSCFLSLKGAVVGAISSLIELAPFFPSSAIWELLDHALLRCLQCHPLLLGKQKNPELGSQQLGIGEYAVHLLYSSVCHTCLRVTWGLKHFCLFGLAFFFIFEGKKTDKNVH